MSFPPFPPNARYSPSRSYNERPLYPPSQPPIQPPRDYHTYPYPQSAPPPSSYRPYDAYNGEPPRSAFPAYEQPRDPYASDSYDPHQPGNAYNSNAGPLRAPPSNYPPPPLRHDVTPTSVSHRVPPRPVSPPRRVAPLQPESPRDSPELAVLTPATTVDLSGVTVAVHSLPQSHLPITKYIPINGDDSIDIHRQLCRQNTSIWYSDGSSRAGEGWSAAVQWILDPGRSGQKMRGCLGDATALDAELGGICKAVEGFEELLQQSIKTATPMSHELVVFCDSQAAIISIDTSSRPQSLHFETLWRRICSEFLQAHLTLVWLPRGNNLEGFVLADKIATVGASNSYLKKKKDNVLAEVYRRPGAGEPAPPGSTEPGPWQRGDADPSRRKSPFQRAAPLPLVVPSPPLVEAEPGPTDALGLNGHHIEVEEDKANQSDDSEEAVQPREGSIFVTHFPEGVSAKDLGILFAQFGNIVAVDIYHITPAHPRFAFVAYTDQGSGEEAIRQLDRKPINLDSDFARDNAADLEVWRQWSGELTVVLSEPPRLVPTSVLEYFPELPEWAKGNVKDQRSDDADTMEVDTQIKHERDTPDGSAARKRDRAEQQAFSPGSQVNSPSPHKRPRRSLDGPPVDYVAKLSELVPTGPPATQLERPAHLPAKPTGPNLPPFPGTLKPEADRPLSTPQPAPARVPSVPVTLPPTPQTAERPADSSVSTSPSMSEHQRASSNKPPLTNSAASPQEYPVKIGAKTLQSQLNLIRNVFSKHDTSNWIAHSCLIAVDLDQARRALQGDLYATDEAFLTGRDLEKQLAAKGFTATRVDAFITKVLKVLDGIAMAEQGEGGEETDGAKESQVKDLEQDLERALEPFTEQTREAVHSAGKLLEYLIRGKEAQEKKRLDVERRVKVLEGMVKVGEVVGGVVRFLLSENPA